jgi:acyl carrier protein
MTGDVLTSEMRALFRDAILEVSGKAVDDVRSEQPIAELGLDSVTVMEMVGSLEDKLQVHFSDDELTRVNTFGDLAKLVERARRA